MFGGGNPGDISRMMEQLGVEMDELDAEEIRITLDDGRELVFRDTEVNHMTGQGMNMYQIVGEPDKENEAGATTTTQQDENEDAETDSGPSFTDDDVELVAGRAGVPEDDARAALEENDGDLAAAIESLE